MAQAGVAYVEIKPDWDGFNREVKRQAPSLDRQFTQMGGKLASNLSRGLTGAGKAAGLQFARGATLGVKVGAAGVAGGLAYAVKKAADFEQQISALGSVSGASAKQMDALRKSAITAGAATKFSALDAAKAQTELAKGGLTTSQILSGGLSSALALAAAGELDLADAATTTVNSMKLFRIQGKDSIKVADALATAANSTTADVSDFALALNQAGSAAKTVGLSFPETITALEALAEVGIKGSDAGTSLKTALVQLASPTSLKAVDAAKELGIQVFDAHGNIKSLVDVSKELQHGLGGLTKEQRIAAATTLVGQDGFRALLALYDAGPKKIAKLEAELNKQGTAAEVAKKKQDNLKGSLEQLGGSAETFGISVGTLLIPAIRRGADELTSFTNDLNKIASNDKLDIGEKISKSFELIKLKAEPLVAKLKAAIIEADIPGAIGDILSRGSDRIGKGVHVGSDFTDKLLAQVQAANLPEKIGDLISRVTPIIVKAFLGAGLLAANSFIKAFMSADGWGKLALGAFLLSKMGGVGTLRKLGATAGMNFSTGFVAASAAGGVPIVGATGAGTKGKGPSAKSGLTSLSPVVGPGFTSGNPVNQNSKPGLTKPTVTQRVTAATRGTGGALTSALNKVPFVAAVTVPFIELEAEKRADATEKAAKSAARAKDALLAAIPDPQKWKQFSDAIQVAKGTFSGTPEDFDAGTAALGRLGLSIDSTGKDVDKVAGVFDNLKGRFSVAQKLFAKGISLDPQTTREDARVVSDTIEKMSSGSSASIKDLRTNVRLGTRAIKKSLGDDTAAGKEALAANFRAAVQNIKTSMNEGKISTKEGTAEIERLMVAALSQFGFSKKQALNIAKTGDADANKGREGGASSVIKKARGGPITGGLPTGDSVPALLERDEYVLNRNAVKKIGRRALDAVNFGSASRFQTGGIVQRFAGGGSVTGDTDFVPALMNALKKLSAAAGQGIFVQSGRRTVAEQLAQGPSTPGHPVAGPNGPHVQGIAADITPGFPAFGALAGKFGLGFTVMPQEPWHIQLLNAAKAAGAAGAADFNTPELKRLLVDGPDSPLKSIVQGGLDTVRGAAQEVVARAAAAASGANGSEANFTPNASAGGQYDKAALKALWIKAGGPASDANTMAAVALAESGGDPNIVNSIGAGGLWQIHPPEKNYLDPMTNAHIAVRKYNENGFLPWEAYTNGSYTKYLQQGGLVGTLARLAKGGPPKGIRPPLPAGIDLGKALRKITTGRTAKLKDAATAKLLNSINGIGFTEQAATLTRLSGNADLYGEYADRASRLTDGNKIQTALEDELTRRQGLSPLPTPLFPADAQQAIVDQLLGRVGGGTQLDWLTKQLGSLFDWRNVITDTDPLVTHLRDDTAALLKDAQARLAAVAAQIKKAEAEIRKAEAERDRKAKHEETLKGKIRDEMDKSPKKRDQAKLKGWREDLVETHTEHVALNQQLTNMRGENKSRARIQDDLTDSIIPALTDKHESLETSHGDLLGNLIDVQGLGGPTTRLPVLPPIGVLGGKLFDVQSLIKDLTDNPPRVEATVPAQSENDKLRADNLESLLRESNQRTAVSEATFDVFKSFPYGGAFKDGGIIPGPVGAPVMILGHGGEEVIPVGDTNGAGARVRVVMEDHRTRVFVNDVEQAVETVTRRQARTGARGLPGIGGGNIR